MNRSMFKTGKAIIPILSVCLLILIGIVRFHQSMKPQSHRLYWEKYDTLVEIIFFSRRRDSVDETILQHHIEQQLDELNLVFSVYDTQSVVSTLNRTQSDRAVIPPCLAKVIHQSLTLNHQTGGMFDITVRPLVKLWNFRQAKIPDSLDIVRILETIGSRYLEIKNDTLIYRRSGIQLDLGAISKGFIIDSIAHYLAHYPGISAGLVNIGGDIATFGSKPVDQGLWSVGIQNPRATDRIWKTLSIESGQAVTTSGDYFRFFTGPDGRRYSHIINPLTGYPTLHHLISVTILAPNAMLADGLSTSVFVLGRDPGIQFLKTHYPQIRYLLITEENGQLKEYSNLNP
ncbi:MAG: FAD:protein FMN transferase [Candidatus Delongbacteria bacterium]|nr:FAD:protein FMN transferase [Candidatus Delongbacteria bacterium]